MNRAVLVTLLAACADPYTVDDYWNELARAHCDTMKDCCTSAEYHDWWTPDGGGSEQSCEAAHDAPTWANRIRDGIAARTIIFDHAAARACVEALASHPCGTFEPAYRYRETYCAPPLVGTIADGLRCVVDEECQSGLCELTAAQDAGVCRRPLPAGSPCSVVDGQYCERPNVCQDDGYCGLGRPAGQSCTSDGDCIDHWCEEAASGTTFCRRACDGA